MPAPALAGRRARAAPQQSLDEIAASTRRSRTRCCPLSEEGLVTLIGATTETRVRGRRALLSARARALSAGAARCLRRAAHRCAPQRTARSARSEGDGAHSTQRPPTAALATAATGSRSRVKDAPATPHVYDKKRATAYRLHLTWSRPRAGLTPDASLLPDDDSKQRKDLRAWSLRLRGRRQRRARRAGCAGAVEHVGVAGGPARPVAGWDIRLQQHLRRRGPVAGQDWPGGGPPACAGPTPTSSDAAVEVLAEVRAHGGTSFDSPVREQSNTSGCFQPVTGGIRARGRAVAAMWGPGTGNTIHEPVLLQLPVCQPRPKKRARSVTCGVAQLDRIALG